MNEQYYVGTDLKFKLDIKSGGLDVNNFDITLKCGNVEYPCVEGTYYKQDPQTGDWYLLVDTTKFGDGMLKMVVYAKVEDRDFDGYKNREVGYRTEVAMMNLCKLKNL